MVDKLKAGIIGVLSLLAIFGGTILLTQEEVDNSYYCPSTSQWGIFYGGVSSTGLTAYPYAENKTNYVRCTKSTWVKLVDYAAELGITPEQLMEQLPEEEIILPQNIGKKYICGQISCVEVK